jgi:hypothetical protein
LSHSREASDRLIQLISSRFNVNKEWIKTGKGEMYAGQPPDVELEQLIEIYNELDEMLRKCLLEQSNMLLKIQNEKIQKPKRKS